ncbi:MAG: transposase [Patescibacteria group bacterium]|nr:transposase [Patescibacteria group bacterium]
MFPDHGRKANRFKGYDYSQDGFYFVTICVNNKGGRFQTRPYFGEIKSGKMILNNCGRIVEKCWFDLLNHYGNCKLDEFIIMPDHFHGIIIIDNAGVDVGVGVGTGFKPVRGTVGVGVGTGFKPVPTIGTTTTTNYSLSEIIRGFKTFSSKIINQNNPGLAFRWQRSFYDHIIFGEQSLRKIREYIRNNPLKWEIDRNNSEDLFM